MTDVWILGGTGRVGRRVAADLAATGIHPVLVGRDATRLRDAAGGSGHGTYVAPTLDDVTAGVRRVRPAVVVNTVGPFTRTGPTVVDACLEAGSDYVDLANDLAAVLALLARQTDAERAGRTLVTGAGFGVTATESVVAWLCADGDGEGDGRTRDEGHGDEGHGDEGHGDEGHGDEGHGDEGHAGRGHRRAARVRTDMLPSLAVQAGPLGEALAGTLVEGLPGVPGGRRFQGRRFDRGRLSPAPLAGEVHALVTPDGDRLTAALMPLGELVAAQRASGAAYVDSASSEVPTGRVLGAVLPLAANLLSLGPVRRLAARRLAAVRLTDRPAPRAHSWGHAVVTWEDGTTAEGWLRLGEAQATTDAVAAEVTRRLVRGRGRPGAFTPAALFGHELAVSLGGEYSRGEGARA